MPNPGGSGESARRYSREVSMRSSNCPTLRIHLWLQNNKGVLAGHGRVQLLEYIEYMRSITAAAKALGMSYRAAWGKIRATEALLGKRLLEETEGKRTGSKLSKDGLRYIAAYRNWESEVEQYAFESAQEHFACLQQYWSPRELPFRKPPPGVRNPGSGNG